MTGALANLQRSLAQAVKFAVTPVLVSALALLASAGAAAQGNAAMQILKRMTDYIGEQKAILATVDTDVEVVTTELQKIQFASSGQVLLNRPDKIRASRTGGYADMELVFDGKTLSILGKNLNSYTQIDAPGTLDQLVERLRTESGAALPFADLLLARAYEELSADVIDAKHIGRGVIDGVECEHLAFRTPEVDWQLWVELGPRPIPRKYVITSKTVTGSPQYTLQVKEWRTDAPSGASLFTFRPPQGSTKVVAETLKQIDEVPAGVVRGKR